MTIPLDAINISTYVRNQLRQRERKDGSIEFYVNICGISARILIRFVEYCWFGRLEMGLDGKPSRYMSRQQELNQSELLEAWLAGDQLGAADFQNECAKQVCRDLAAGKYWMTKGPKLVYDQTKHDIDSPIRRFVDYIFAHGPRSQLFGNAKVGTYPEDFLLKVLVTPTETESDSGTKKFWLRLAKDLGTFAARQKIDLTVDDETEEDSDMAEVDEVVMTPPEPARSQRPAAPRFAAAQVVIPPSTNTHRATAPTPDDNDTVITSKHGSPDLCDPPPRSANKRSRDTQNWYPDRSVRQFSVELPDTIATNQYGSTGNRPNKGRVANASSGPNWLQQNNRTRTNTDHPSLFHHDTPPQGWARSIPVPSIPDSVDGGADDYGDDDEFFKYRDHSWRQAPSQWDEPSTTRVREESESW